MLIRGDLGRSWVLIGIYSHRVFAEFCCLFTFSFSLHVDSWHHHQGRLALDQCCLQPYEGLFVGLDRVFGRLFVCFSEHISLFGAPFYEGLFSSPDGVAGVMSALWIWWQVSLQVAAPLHERLFSGLDGVPPEWPFSSLDGFVSDKTVIFYVSSSRVKRSAKWRFAFCKAGWQPCIKGNSCWM